MSKHSRSSQFAAGQMEVALGAGSPSAIRVFTRMRSFFGKTIVRGNTRTDIDRIAPDEKRVYKVNAGVELPRVYVSWVTPAAYKPGDAELDALSYVLSQGKSSRLYKRLVYDLQIAKDVAAYQASSQLSSTFEIVATAVNAWQKNPKRVGIHQVEGFVFLWECEAHQTTTEAGIRSGGDWELSVDGAGWRSGGAARLLPAGSGNAGNVLPDSVPT